MAFFGSVIGLREPVVKMEPVFLSQSSNLQGRIGLHCKGTVNDSMLREKIALRMGFGVLKTYKAKTGQIVKSIHSEDPKTSEKEVSAVIAAGRWRLIRPGDEVALTDFQRFLNERISPKLKEPERPWDKKMEQRYSDLLQRLTDSILMKGSDHESMPELSGIYVFYHDSMP